MATPDSLDALNTYSESAKQESAMREFIDYVQAFPKIADLPPQALADTMYGLRVEMAIATDVKNYDYDAYTNPFNVPKTVEAR